MRSLANLLKAAAVGLAVAAALPSLATAQSRPMTPRMPCQQIANLVAARGSIVLGTGQYTYDRYVAAPGFCLRGERADPAWVPAADTPQCYIGFRCSPFDYDDF